MAISATRRILSGLIGLHGALRVVVFDVDELRRFVHEKGDAAGLRALEMLTVLFEKRAAQSNGQVHFSEPDRFMVVLPACTYDEAVAWAERSVDAVRVLGISSSAGDGTARLAVTGVVVSVESRSDVERFQVQVNALLADGKSTGGNAIIRDR